MGKKTYSSPPTIQGRSFRYTAAVHKRLLKIHSRIDSISESIEFERQAQHRPYLGNRRLFCPIHEIRSHRFQQLLLKATAFSRLACPHHRRHFLSCPVRVYVHGAVLLSDTRYFLTLAGFRVALCQSALDTDVVAASGAGWRSYACMNPP